MLKIISEKRRAGSLRVRQNFAKIPQAIDIPNLIEIQGKSFESFMQSDVAYRHRKVKGLEEVFRDVFPVSDLNVNAQIEYVGLEVGAWECDCGDYGELGGPGEVCDKCGQEAVYKEKHTLRECREKGLTYSDPIRIVVRLVLFDREAVDINANTVKHLLGKYIVEDLKNPATGKVLFPARTEITPEVIAVIRERKVAQIISNVVREVKEQKIFLGEMPMMTSNGTFMINGVERVVVSQMHRSPGAFFSHDKGKSHASGKILYSARIIPDRGSWIDFEFDIKDILYVKIDRRRKLPATILLQAFGMQVKEMLETFYNIETITISGTDKRVFVPSKSLLIGHKVLEDIVDPKSDEVILKANKKVVPIVMRKLSRMSKSVKVEIDPTGLIGCYLFDEIVDKGTGEVFAETNQVITEELLGFIFKNKTKQITILRVDEELLDTAIRDTVAVSKVDNQVDAIREIYKRLRPGDPPTPEIAKSLF
ncbi:MAG TPA: DNA-directed RNA polymerase subunit beta, partial [Rhodospirillales bacterium]|nr:DNA-directed RNA polymerase subunit beta [Rhodospirillales bacterium]